jgi:hypothetical protein
MITGLWIYKMYKMYLENLKFCLMVFIQKILREFEGAVVAGVDI